MKGAKILFLEDDIAFRRDTAETLEECGYLVTRTRDLEGFEQQAKDQKFDLYLMDRGIDYPSGMKDSLNLRETMLREGDTTATIWLTGQSDKKTDDEQVKGLSLRLDGVDYVIKGEARVFRLLLKRIENLLMALRPIIPDLWEMHGLQLHRGFKSVTYHDVPVEVGKAQFEMLWLLAKQVENGSKKGGIVSRDTLKSSELKSSGKKLVNGDDLDANLNQMVARLRQSFKDAKAREAPVETVKGKGYRLVFR